MNITVDLVVAWVIVGALAGSLAGMLVTGKKEGFGRGQTKSGLNPASRK
jgi:hypothetical protein